MRKLAFVCSLLVITIGFAFRTSAQESTKAPESAKAQEATQPVHYYRLDFVIEELNSDGKPVNSRTFSIGVNTDPHNSASIRTGSRVPFATGPKSTPPANMQFQYIDLGVNVDVHNVQEVERKLALDVNTEIIGAAAFNNPDLNGTVILRNKWQASLLIPIGKPTVAFTSDSLESKGSTRVLVTATPIANQ
jgi:hypothetical protein